MNGVLRGFLAGGMALAMTGCSIGVRPDSEPSRQLPAHAMQLCPALTQLEGDTMSDLVNKIAELSSTYQQCALLHKELVDWVDRSNH